jgi:hypothetical protein
MEKTIEKIIREKIPEGCIFDAHSIINYLIQNESDTYLSSYKNNWTTKYYHSEISKQIASFENKTLERMKDSWSLNINNNFSRNACWVKQKTNDTIA